MIGIFDSGIGGLTVVKEILKQLPGYQLIYFGDTARTPYGNKSPETINRYALEDTEFLIKSGAKLIVIACNTASAVAAGNLKEKFPALPIFEVITPAISQAVQKTKNKKIGVIGTRTTIASKIYEHSIIKIDNSLETYGKACPLFVPLVEEGWADKSVTKIVARTYLQSLKMRHIDTLIMGCTHYPLIKSVIQAKIGRRVSLVDPAEETASQIQKYLATHPNIESALPKNNRHQFFFSDLAPHLNDLSLKWLGQKINPRLYIME